MSHTWKLSEMPRSNGGVAIVTGANSGLGKECSRALVAKGYRVIMACRHAEAAARVKAEFETSFPDARLEFIPLDLGSFDSVKDFASAFLKRHSSCELLINNAGVMMPPYRTTESGYELQLGVNYLGHFLLTALLIHALEATKGARVVTVSSLAHKWGDIYFDDLNFRKSYDKRKAYGQSKLACLLFAYELQRRLKARGSQVRSMAAHPGVAMTNLMRYMPALVKWLTPLVAPLVAQSSKRGALPLLRAALDPNLAGGEYLGPSGTGELKGDPVIVGSNAKSHDKGLAAELWQWSEKQIERPFF